VSEINFRHETLILDASPLICLYASGQMRSILGSIPKNVTVATYVKTMEITHIYDRSVKENEQPTESIDLEPIITEGLLSVVNLETEQEAMTVIDLVIDIGQGEAFTGAIADHRKWAIGVDDKKARRVFAERMPHLQLLSTLDLIRHWEARVTPTSNIIREVLENIRYRAKYQPGNSNPHYSWWQECIKPSKDE
jgi:predicted nucleic acid-binding protein